MSNGLLFIERAGYRIMIDDKDGHYRVACNGAVHAQFCHDAMGEIPALKEAINFVEQLEANCLKYPKAP